MEHFNPADPPRSRANKRKGRGTFANDRPPVLGTIGRETGHCRLRVVLDTKQATLSGHVRQFTLPETFAYTDEYDSYAACQRWHSTVAHGAKEWARDDDGDGWREVHTNTIEGLWTGLRAFLAPFRGVSKHFLSGYVALYEFRVNFKRISPTFIFQLVTLHSFST
ncbi:MAG TPA: transposase [Candidatus Saccharimonadales bacterium]|nr:transposase [Candidatus Saccharimonadales bacterium]